VHSTYGAITQPTKGNYIMYAPSIDSDITVTVTGSVAGELIAKAGLGFQDGACWHLRNGGITTDPLKALTDALVTITEEEV
jgi:hypothetical protein